MQITISRYSWKLRGYTGHIGKSSRFMQRKLQNNVSWRAVYNLQSCILNVAKDNERPVTMGTFCIYKPHQNLLHQSTSKTGRLNWFNGLKLIKSLFSMNVLMILSQEKPSSLLYKKGVVNYIFQVNMSKSCYIELNFYCKFDHFRW